MEYSEYSYLFYILQCTRKLLVFEGRGRRCYGLALGGVG